MSQQPRLAQAPSTARWLRERAQRANRCHSSLGSRGRRAQRGGCVSAVPDVHAGASADAELAAALAAEHGVPVLPRGAGTSLAGQTVGAALVLDLSRHMSRILELDPAART